MAWVIRGKVENLVERMVITAEEYIITEDTLPCSIYEKKTTEKYDIHNKTLKEILENVEKQVFASML